MMRNEIDIKEFTVDVEKIIVKEGYNGEENEGINDDGVEWDENEVDHINKAVLQRYISLYRIRRGGVRQLVHDPEVGRCAQVIGDSINIWVS